MPARSVLMCQEYQSYCDKEYQSYCAKSSLITLRVVQVLVCPILCTSWIVSVAQMKNKQLLEGALASIKTVRKNLGGVTMIGQSADDLSANADSIVNSCTSFLFLKDATFNRKRYAELFKMNEQQIALFESVDREGLYKARWPYQSCQVEPRQPQLRDVFDQTERPGGPVETDRKVRSHRGHRSLYPRRDRVTVPDPR